MTSISSLRSLRRVVNRDWALRTRTRSVGLGGLDVDGVGTVTGEVIVASGKGKDAAGDVLFEAAVHFLGCW